MAVSDPLFSIEYSDLLITGYINSEMLMLISIINTEQRPAHINSFLGIVNIKWHLNAARSITHTHTDCLTD